MQEWVMGLQEVESPIGDQNDIPTKWINPYSLWKEKL
jgi:hypothetical protein